MAAAFIELLEKSNPDNKRKHEIVMSLVDILNRGYTYNDIRKAINWAYKNHSQFPYDNFKETHYDNLMKQGVRYYHKELNIRSELSPIIHDVDTGTIIRRDSEYWLEPRASYTLDDMVNYFYSKHMVDEQEYFRKRMIGLFRSYVNRYGIDITLFMIEHAARLYESEHVAFTLHAFDSYHQIAVQYLEEIKNNCVYSGGDAYVPRKRVLFA